MTPIRNPILISACLIGINSRYNGTNAVRRDLIKRYANKILIPVCPEQLGGLPTPRPQAEITPPCSPSLSKRGAGGVVIDITGKDVTKEFIHGADEVLKIVRLLGAKKALLKEKSPSCGVRLIYRNGEIINGMGITAQLLKNNGIEVEGID
ncbi:MAG: DUF523 domain-containing protein [Deltaproteobacteria bacterium]|nr:DUF523 domain-containing protein [Deltaproteobacteria bacterium]